MRAVPDRYDRAAIDISTGHAIDSYFRADLRDPWARDALRLFVDLSINHDKIAFPYPSAKALEADDDDLIPEVFAKGRAFVSGLKTRPADSIALDAALVLPQFTRFSSWLRSSPTDVALLRTWLAMHLKQDRIKKAHRPTVPVHVAGKLVGRQAMEELAHELGGIDAYGVEYAFDVFVRGIQYNIAWGEDAPYFPHPLRTRLQLPQTSEDLTSQCFWSWGAYITTLLEKDPQFRSLSAMLDLVQAIKERASGRATWFELAYQDRDSQHKMVEAVAAEARLPATFKADALAAIDRGTKVTGGLASSAARGLGAFGDVIGALSGIVVTYSSHAIADRAKGVLPGGVAKAFAGRVEWPGLKLQTPVSIRP